MRHVLRVWLYERRWSGLLRFAVCTALAVFVWKYRSKAVQDLLLAGAALYVLIRRPRECRIWLRPAGIPFVALAVYTLALLPFSTAPADSVHDLVKYLDVLAAAFAIPVLFRGQDRIEGAVLYSAAGLTMVLGYDLVRLAVCLRGDLWIGAHGYEPFLFDHSNLSSMVAGAAFLALVPFAWKWRRDWLRGSLCALGMLVNLAYLVALASRGPQIAFALTCGLSGLVLLPGWRAKGIWLLLAVLAATALVVNAAAVNPRFADRAGMRGFVDRDKVWEHTWELAWRQPVSGYGHGRRVFVRVYNATDPPESLFDFQHAHEYWLHVFFSYGLVGVVLHAFAWGVLGGRLLWTSIRRSASFGDRLFPGVVLLMIAFIHVYGLADWPAGIVSVMLIWLVPAGLAVTAAGSTIGMRHG